MSITYKRDGTTLEATVILDTLQHVRVTIQRVKRPPCRRGGKGNTYYEFHIHEEKELRPKCLHSGIASLQADAKMCVEDFLEHHSSV